MSKSATPSLKVRSTEFPDSIEFPLDQLPGPPQQHWSDYVRGVAALTRETVAPLPGVNVLVEVRSLLAPA